jgi:FkbM family methyltransferase
MAFYRTFVADGDLVFDVGANRGSRSRIFHMLGARVVAFEPQPALVSLLRDNFRGTATRIIEAAIGDEDSAARPMFISTQDVLSTLSPEWIEAMKRSGRFRRVETWEHNQQISVPVRTLDAVIREHGVPRFTKIDVEGYELQVLNGLTVALPALSIEFTSETPEATTQCIRRLASIADYRFQISLGESMRLELAGWLTADEITSYIDNTLKHQKGVWGDFYARRSADPDRVPA